MMHTILRRTLLLSSSAFLLVGLALTSQAHAGTTPGPQFGPSFIPAGLHVVERERGMWSSTSWRRSDGHVRQLNFIALDPVDERSIVDQGRATVHAMGTPGAASRAVVVRNAARVAPDGYDTLDDLMRSVWPLVVRGRSGADVLRFGGSRGVRVGAVALAPDACSSLGRGTRTVWLDERTFVPVRVVERRGRDIVMDHRFARRGTRASDFAPLRIRGVRERRDEGFVRRSPRAAAKLLRVQVSLPAYLPDGFVLDHTGSAARGAMIGPEASFPRSRGVFFAKWRRGLESIDLTIRGAVGTLARDWDESDPFGGECEPTSQTKTRVGGAPATYAIGEERAARLWWGVGGTLYTLSGAFPADELVRIAESLQPVAVDGRS